jgi:two-component system response regulator FixJ
MSNEIRISLIDRDVRRRASIAHCLASGGIPVEPLESTEELINRWPADGVILAHDEGETLHALMNHVGRSGRWLPIAVYSQEPTPVHIVDAVLEGAIAYLAWPFGFAEMRETIGAVEQRADRLGGAKLREAVARSRVDRLTRREREVLQGVATGLSNRKIGETLAISPRTVEIHRANMLHKMGASHTSEAIRLAIEASLIA